MGEEATPEPEPVAEKAEEPVVEVKKEATPEPEPVAEKAEEPVAEAKKEATPEPEPVAEKAEEPVAEVKKEATPEPEPVAEKVEEPVAEVKKEASFRPSSEKLDAVPCTPVHEAAAVSATVKESDVGDDPISPASVDEPITPSKAEKMDMTKLTEVNVQADVISGAGP